MEKHILSSSLMLNNDHQKIVDDVKKWLKLFSTSSIGLKMGSKINLNDLFIGYNDDTIATIVLNLFQGNSNLIENMEDDNNNESSSKISHNQLVTETIKILLRCASADSIIKTDMQKIRSKDVEIKDVWEEYFENQKHTSLKDLIEKHMESTIDEKNFNKNLLQITTNSNFFLGKEDIENLAHALKVKSKDAENCVLQSFETQQQFELKIKNFLSKLKNNQSSKQLLLIQCNFDDNSYYDLISCARFTICEQIKEYSDRREDLKNGYIIFLINLDRQRSKHFVGFQVGHWSCYHIDEIDTTVDYLPSFQNLRNKSLSVLIEEAMADLGNKPKETRLNLSLLIKSLAQEACSLIDDTSLMRTIQRIELFTKLCDDSEFLYGFCDRLMKLQRQKPIEKTGLAKNWLIKEAASSENINEFTTLKKSCKNYIQSKLSPLMSFIISKLDSYSNMDVLIEAIESHIDWKRELWLRIFKDDKLFKINYEDMCKKDFNEEIKRFFCVTNFSGANTHSHLKINFPFFWILSENFNDLTHNFFITSVSAFSDLADNSIKSNLYQTFMKTMPYLFENQQILGAVQEIFKIRRLDFNEIIKHYLNDFILFNCKIATENELKVVKNLMNIDLPKSTELKDSFASIHFKFKLAESQIKTYLDFSNFEPSINEEILLKSNYVEIDTEACLICIHVYEKKSQVLDLHEGMKKVRFFWFADFFLFMFSGLMPCPLKLFYLIWFTSGLQIDLFMLSNVSPIFSFFFKFR
jgi:hypothetical protein